MSAFDNASVMEEARHFFQAIGAWLEQYGDRKWQAAKTEHDLALSKVMLSMLLEPETIAAGTEWHCFINTIVSKSDDDEEWAQTSQWWELFVRADGIICDEYYNHATIIGAGQTYLRRIRSTEAESAEQRRELAAWRTGYEQALTRDDAHVNVSSTQIKS